MVNHFSCLFLIEWFPRIFQPFCFSSSFSSFSFFIGSCLQASRLGGLRICPTKEGIYDRLGRIASLGTGRFLGWMNLNLSWFGCCASNRFALAPYDMLLLCHLVDAFISTSQFSIFGRRFIFANVSSVRYYKVADD